MKAKVKESGEVFVVYGVVNKTCDGYAIGEVELFVDDHDSFLYDMTPAYWEKLRHQYAGMAMQGILSNPELFKATAKNAEEFGLIVPQAVAIDANCFAHALVEKMKNQSV